MRAVINTIGKARVYEILFVVGFILVTSTAASAKEEQSGWVLLQNSNYGGPQVAYISSSGVVVKSKLLTTIIRLPSKKVTVYRKKSKTYCNMDYKQWLTFLKAKINPAQKREVVKGEKGTIAGLSAQQYLLKVPYRGGMRISYEYWVASHSPIPKEMTEPLSVMANMPVNLGIPLAINKVGRSGNKIKALETMMHKDKSIPEETFKCPAGFKQVSDPVSVVLGAGT